MLPQSNITDINIGIVFTGSVEKGACYFRELNLGGPRGKSSTILWYLILSPRGPYPKIKTFMSHPWKCVSRWPFGLRPSRCARCSTSTPSPTFASGPHCPEKVSRLNQGFQDQQQQLTNHFSTRMIILDNASQYLTKESQFNLLIFPARGRQFMWLGHENE